MITVISPAKRLNETLHPLPGGSLPTAPLFAADAARLAKIAGALTAQDLCTLMGISPKLGALNHDRFAAFRGPTPEFPAAYLFDGDTYAGLEARRMEADTLHWAQGRLRILSGLYGLLRPLDAIRPYRLEMGARLTTSKGSDLYAYWGSKIAQALKAQAQEIGATELVNCASTEYFGAVNVKALKLRIVTPVFLEERAGDAKIVSFWAKKARGAMARFICENHLTNPDDLRGFSQGGYAYRAELSDEGRLVYTRVLPETAAA